MQKALNDEIENWQEDWENGWTGWATREKGYNFASDVRDALIALYGDALVTKQDLGKTVVGALKGKRVFLPLCGDSLAVDFYAGACGCHVVGIDLFPGALETIVKRQSVFADDGSEKAAPFETKEYSEGKFAEYRSTALIGKLGGSMRLFRGDFWDVAEHLHATEKMMFDVVVDRAAMLAMHPEKQQPHYAMVLTKLLSVRKENGEAPPNVDGCIILECPIRSAETIGRGPPYHMPIAHVKYFFAAPEYRVTAARDESRKDAVTLGACIFCINVIERLPSKPACT